MGFEKKTSVIVNTSLAFDTTSIEHWYRPITSEESIYIGPLLNKIVTVYDINCIFIVNV